MSLDVAALGVPSLSAPFPARRLLGLVVGEGALARAISAGQAGFAWHRLSGPITQQQQEIQQPHIKENQLLAGALGYAWGDRISEVPAAPAGSCSLRRWHLARDLERLSGAQPKGGGGGT